MGTVQDSAISSPVLSSAPPPLGCWCRRGELVTQFRTRRFGLVRCTACGCFRIDPPPIQGEEDGARFYTDFYTEDHYAGANEVPPGKTDGTRDSRFWKVVEQFPDLDRPRESVVDIGCGEGGLCAELQSAGWRSVTGFDLSQSRIARARAGHPGIRFFDRPFSDDAVAEESLDLVIMDNVVEHLPDPVLTLKSVARSLKVGGRLVLITPNMLSGHFRLLGRRWTVELAPHAHIFLFTPDSLSRLTSVTGFGVEAVGSYQFAPYPWTRVFDQARRGKLKEAAWHAMNEVGSLYARMIRTGPMLYVVARREGRESVPSRIPT